MGVGLSRTGLTEEGPVLCLCVCFQMATEDFKAERKLGEGGFGVVFSGTLHHTPVAIKVLKNANAMQAANEFQQEVGKPFPHLTLPLCTLP